MRRVLYILILTATAAPFAGCDRDEDLLTVGNPEGPQLKELFTFSQVPADETPADNYTAALITVRLHPEAKEKQIEIVTSSGKFSNDDTIITLNANSNGLATAELFSDEEGIARIRATTGKLTIDTTIAFSKALPDDMTLAADKYVGDNAGEFTLTVKTVRPPGTPTDGAKIFFTIAIDDPDAMPLIVEPFVFTENHEATATIKNPFQAAGWFTVTATTEGEAGAISRQIRIKIE